MSRMYLESIHLTESLISPVQLGKVENHFSVSSVILLYSFNKELNSG